MNEWVVWFYIEPFTLHLNGNRNMNRDEKNRLHTYFSSPGTALGGVF